MDSALRLPSHDQPSGRRFLISAIGIFDKLGAVARRHPRSDEIRGFLLQATPDHGPDLVVRAMKHFGLTRQAILWHLKQLIAEGLIVADGKTFDRFYALAVQARHEVVVPIESIDEDRLWRTEVYPFLADAPRNILDIWSYGLTEMVNNVRDHSGGREMLMALERTAVTTDVVIRDDGVGIFRKIKNELNLEDERHAVLELSKGKLTTDPAHHTGEGIFFTSRMFDRFSLHSGDLVLVHDPNQDLDLLLDRRTSVDGTQVRLSLANNSDRQTEKVFSKYTVKGEDYGFSRTVVPVRLLRYGDERVISRSQAKRLLARVERFKRVILDFRGVDYIGQAFADEVFRVFPSQHPATRIYATNTRKEVKRMIERVKAGSG